MDAVTAAVRRLRQHLGDTQQQFAARLDLAISTVVRYELTRPPRGKHLVQLERLAVQHGLKKEAAVFRDALHIELYGLPLGRGGAPAAKYRERSADTLVPQNEFERKLVQDLLWKIRHGGHPGKHISPQVKIAIKRAMANISEIMRLKDNGETAERIASALRLSPEDVRLWIVVGETCRLEGKAKDYALREFFSNVRNSSIRSAELAVAYGIPISTVKAVRKAQARLGLN